MKRDLMGKIKIIKPDKETQLMNKNLLKVFSRAEKTLRKILKQRDIKILRERNFYKRGN